VPRFPARTKARKRCRKLTIGPKQGNKTNHARSAVDRRRLPAQRTASLLAMPGKQSLTFTQAHDLLPKQADLLIFRPAAKSFSIHWQDGESQCFRMTSPRGRKRTLREITFVPVDHRKPSGPPPPDPG
jgi:hypothetical protein